MIEHATLAMLHAQRAWLEACSWWVAALPCPRAAARIYYMSDYRRKDGDD